MRLAIYSLSVTAMLFGAAFLVGEMQAVEANSTDCEQAVMAVYDQCLSGGGSRSECSGILQPIEFVCNQP